MLAGCIYAHIKEKLTYAPKTHRLGFVDFSSAGTTATENQSQTTQNRKRKDMNAIATNTTWEKDLQDASKSTRLAIHIGDPLGDMILRWASLDLEPTEEFDLDQEDPCNDSS